MVDVDVMQQNEQNVMDMFDYRLPHFATQHTQQKAKQKRSAIMERAAGPATK